MKGSFFNLGLTNSATKLSWWLLHMFRSSPNSRCCSASFMSLNKARISLTCESSCSAAVLQSGALCVGVGLGAGVGGDAGADGRRLCGMLEEGSGLGVWIGRGAERDIMPRFRVREVGEENMVGVPVSVEGETTMAPSISRWRSGLVRPLSSSLE